MENPGLPLATTNNPLGLQPNAQGQVPTLIVVEPEGEGRYVRLNQCTDFFRFLDGQEGYIQAFNHLPHYQQVIAV